MAIVWRPVDRVEARFGSIEFSASDEPPVLLVVPKGYIGPTLVRRDLAIARRFACEQRRPWSYVVDPTDAVPNPLNLVFLRSVRKLPNVRSYVVVARRQPMRTIARLLVALGGPHAVFPSIDVALEAAGRVRGDEGPGVVVRAMTGDDVDVVQRVEVASGERFRSIADPRISQCAGHPPMPTDSLRRFMAAGLAWVATVDDAVVGFLVAEVLEDALHVEEVAVEPAHAGRGHATALLDVVVEQAAALGLSGVTLTTFRDVPWNRPFYERRRFRVLAEEELTDVMRARFLEEEQQYGLIRDLRVVMRRDVAPVVVVREATPDDLPAITRLFNALIPTTTIAWRDHLADEAEMATWFSAQQDEANPVLVADVGGEVVGYTTWTWFRGGPRFPGYRHTRELTIHVDGRHHGRSVGRTLIDALVERASSAGLRVLVAGVDAENEASIIFHGRLGFTEVARMPEVGRKFDRWLDLVLLQRTIG